MSKGISNITDKFIVKILISLYILIVGFGYFTFLIYSIYQFCTTPDKNWWFLALDIIIYFIVLAPPSKFAWRGIESISKDKIKIKGKIMIMIISQIIAYLYMFFSLYEIWISGPLRRRKENKEERKLDRSAKRTMKLRNLKSKHSPKSETKKVNKKKDNK